MPRILGAAPGLDRQEARELDGVVMILTVDRLRVMHEVEQRQSEKRLDLLLRPVDGNRSDTFNWR